MEEDNDMQDMVMERDGKFEVLSTVDLQASREHDAFPPHQEDDEPLTVDINHHHQPTKVSSHRETTDMKHCTMTHPLEEEEAERFTESISEDATGKSEESENNETKGEDLEQTSRTKESTSSFSPQPNLTREDEYTRDPPASSEIETHQRTARQSPTSLEKQQSTKNRDTVMSLNPNTQTETLGIAGTPPQTSLKPREEEEIISQLHIRTQSAPASKKSKLTHKKEEEEREKRKRMSEAAYSAWIAKKNKERKHKLKQEMLKKTTTAEDKKLKKEMSEKVYQNWLEAKNKELQAQRLQSRPLTSVPKKDEEECRRAFESWLEKKQMRQEEEMKKERIKTQEMEESAKKVDPTVIDTVYREWLQKKKEQAREETLKREHYKKLYFSQPQMFKKHTQESICFPEIKKEHPVVKKAREERAKRFEGF